MTHPILGSPAFSHPHLTFDYAREACHRDTRLRTANHPRHAIRSLVSQIGQYWALHLAIAGAKIRRVLAELGRDIQYRDTTQGGVGALSVQEGTSFDMGKDLRSRRPIQQSN